jgi:eukaryotic-like serine/threonine-protein kinase
LGGVEVGWPQATPGSAPQSPPSSQLRFRGPYQVSFRSMKEPNDLPIELQKQLEAILFREPDAAAQTVALDALFAANPEHGSAIAAWRGSLQGVGVGGSGGLPPEIPDYRLEVKLGEGGFGEVWRGEQLHPVRRMVALKVLKLGMDSGMVLQRFAREQDALARMSHDAIAKILDAGTTPSGQPFFAMELVDGAPITEWCDRERLSLSARLELFQEVCHAVQHAHQKGLLHRDLKPSNVLVTKVGERVAPKLIDFGIARALEQEVGSAALTETGMMLGTPAYMAPEQARGDIAAIDTRTDVYALGAILYELLTGMAPLAGDSVQVAGPWELRRRILEGETMRPSLTVRQDPGSLVTRAAARRVAVSLWTRQLRLDLDWIVLKAMAKEPDQRYSSAAELAADVQRYMRLEPVLAGPPSAAYRLRKFMRRYRLHVGAAAAVMMTAVVGGGAALVQFWRAESAAQQALDEAIQARAAEARANDEAARAHQAETMAIAEVARQERVSSFLATLFSRTDVGATGVRLRSSLVASMLRSREAVLADSGRRAAAIAAFDEASAGVVFAEVSRELFLSELLNPAVERARTEFADDPTVLASLLGRIGESCSYLGEAASAVSLARESWQGFEAVHGTDHQSSLKARAVYATLVADRDPKVAREVAVLGIARAEAVLGAGHATALALRAAHASALRGLGELDAAEVLSRQVLAERRATLPPDDSRVLSACNNLATVLASLNKVTEAVELLQSIPITTSPPVGVVASTHNLVALMQRASQYREALALLDERLPGVVDALGDGHEHTQALQLQRAECLQRLRRGDEAMKLLLQVHARAVQLHGAKSMPVGLAAQSIAALAARSNDLETAAQYSRETLDILDRLEPADSPGIVATLGNLGSILQRQGSLEEAEAKHRDAYARATLHEGHPFLAKATINLATCLCDRGSLDEGLDLFLVGHRMQESLPVDHQERILVAHDLGRRLVAARPAQAVEFTTRYVEALRGDSRLQRGLRGEFLTMRCKSHLQLREFEAAEADGIETSELFAALGAPGRVARRELAPVMIALYESWAAVPGAPSHEQELSEWRKLRQGR